MYLFRQHDTIAWERCTATIGFFDGIHRGHQFLIEEMRQIAKQQGENSLVITFDQHPRKVLDSNFRPKLITTLEEKIAHIAETGVDACFVLEFSPSLAHMSAADFIRNVLVKKLHVSHLLIGYDHRFGHHRTDGFEQYQQYAKKLPIDIIQATQYKQEGVKTVNSSTIRAMIEQGDIEGANRLLGRMFSFKGKVVGGFKVGRTVGFPTANLLVEDRGKMTPANGVYAVKVLLKGKTYKGMMNIGYRPTLSDQHIKSIEVHIIGFSEDIYTQEIEVYVSHKIREEMKFGSVADLVAQIEKDKQMVIQTDY